MNVKSLNPLKLLVSLLVSVTSATVLILTSSCSLVNNHHETNYQKGMLGDRITIEWQQESKVYSLPEDSQFSVYLNTPNLSMNMQPPIPNAWNHVRYNSSHAPIISVKNCPHLDLLELAYYSSFDQTGKPNIYSYMPICGPHTHVQCSITQTLSKEIHDSLTLP